MVALWEVTGIEDTAKVAEKLIHAVAEPYTMDGHTIRVTTSVGASIYPMHGNDADGLIKTADAALYEAKRSGKNIFRVGPVAASAAKSAFALRRA